MKPSLRSIDSWRSAFRLMWVACALTAFGAACAPAQEAPYAEFQYATVTGSSNVINVTMLPVVTESGAVVYRNMTLQFEVSSTGAITLAPGSPTVVAAPTPQISSFEAGNYVGPSTIGYGEAFVSISGPGVTVGGSTEWSLAASTGAWDCTYPSSATFYVGPITSNPLYSRLKAAGITSANYNYGIIGEGPTCFPGNAWYAGSLIGLSQTGSTLTLVSFTEHPNVDYSIPQDQITYTLKP
jgi:hypothetical protein